MAPSLLWRRTCLFLCIVLWFGACIGVGVWLAMLSNARADTARYTNLKVSLSNDALRTACEDDACELKSLFPWVAPYVKTNVVVTRDSLEALQGGDSSKLFASIHDTTVECLGGCRCGIVGVGGDLGLAFSVKDCDALVQRITDDLYDDGVEAVDETDLEASAFVAKYEATYGLPYATVPYCDASRKKRCCLDSSCDTNSGSGEAIGGCGLGPAGDPLRGYVSNRGCAEEDKLVVVERDLAKRRRLLEAADVSDGAQSAGFMVGSDLFAMCYERCGCTWLDSRFWTTCFNY